MATAPKGSPDDSPSVPAAVGDRDGVAGLAHGARAAMQRARRWGVALLVNGGLLLAAFAVACGLGEGLVRFAAPQQLILIRPDVWRAVDTVGWEFRPNLHTTLNWGERTVHVVTDQDGFRVGSSGRASARTRLLIIGDSFMAALQVEYEQSLAGLLQARLPERLGRPVAVWNAGQAGWDPPQYFFQTRDLLARGDSFDLIVVSVYLGNDVVLRRPDRIPPRTPEEIHHFRLPRRLGWGEFVDGLLRPINDYLKTRSQLYILLKTSLHSTLMRLGLTADYFPDEFLRRDATSPRWDVTAGICRDMALLAGRHHIPILFVLVPAPYQADPAVFKEYLRGFHIDSSTVDLDQPNRLLGARLVAYGLNVIDAVPHLRAVQEGTSQKLYGSIDRHLSAAGHEVLEELLEPTVVAMLGATREPASNNVNRSEQRPTLTARDRARGARR